jgi:hypothetical protein
MKKDAEAQQLLYDLIITRDPEYAKSTRTGQYLFSDDELNNNPHIIQND